MRRILLVEDEPDVRSVFGHILFSAGYLVDVAGTFADGMALLGAHAYDLVVADGRLGDGSGLEIADAAKARGIAALILTGYASQFPRERLERHPYVLKPARAAELLDVVARCLKPDPI